MELSEIKTRRFYKRGGEVLALEAISATWTAAFPKERASSVGRLSSSTRARSSSPAVGATRS